jgi:hypothetical protein
MCIDKPNKTKHAKSPKASKTPKAPQPDQINKPKKEKQINELLNTPQTMPSNYKIIKAPPHDTSTATATTKRIVESITVCF